MKNPTESAYASGILTASGVKTPTSRSLINSYSVNGQVALRPRLIRSRCKFLTRKWDQTTYEMHKDKLRDAKPIVDSKPPRTYMHMHNRLKQLQTEQERLAHVERDNRILMEKISDRLRTRGRVDNINNYMPRSLNRTHRQKNLLKITHENQALLKRLQTIQPHIYHMKYLHEFDLNQRYMANISQYPRKYIDKIPLEDLSPAQFEKERIKYLKRMRSLYDNNQQLVYEMDHDAYRRKSTESGASQRFSFVPITHPLRHDTRHSVI